MNLLNDKTKQQVQSSFSVLSNPVKLVVFTQEMECDYCAETRQLVQEVAELSDQIAVDVHDFVADRAIAAQYGVDKIPALVVMRGGDAPKDYGIRFFGIPSGYEFSTLIEDIVMVSTGESGLTPKTKEELASLSKPLHLQVFVTPT